MAVDREPLGRQTTTAESSVASCAADAPSIEHLGRMLFFDENLSANRNQSCAACHAARVGWTGPDAASNRAAGVYEGSIHGRFGNRKPPSAAYAMRSPVLSYDPQNGFVGGNFWDGRATGWDLGQPVADQARGPYLNPVEQALPDASTLVERACAAPYGRMLRRFFGTNACSDPAQGYVAIARSVAAFESSAAVSPYTSKYDAFLRGEATLTDLEQLGLELFEGKARCSTCHSTAGDAEQPPVFSDFGFNNLGVPKNPENPFYGMDQVTVDGTPINPAGAAWVDPGLGGFLEQLVASDDWRSAPYVPASVSSLTKEQLSALAKSSLGQQRVPTLRNVDRRPNPRFVKAYMHNGYFKSLKNVVHFYNTRDVLPRCSGAVTEDVALAQQCWPAPEVSEGVDTQTGNLQLSDAEEDALVAFLGTLSDTGPGRCEARGGQGGRRHGAMGHAQKSKASTRGGAAGAAAF